MQNKNWGQQTEVPWKNKDREQHKTNERRKQGQRTTQDDPAIKATRLTTDNRAARAKTSGRGPRFKWKMAERSRAKQW